MDLAWGVRGVDGLYSGFLASAAMARQIRSSEPQKRLNTDDGTLIEYECARSILSPGASVIHELRALALRNADFAPPLTNGAVDLNGVVEARIARAIHERVAFNTAGFAGDGDAVARMEARTAFAQSKFSEALAAWRRQQSLPVHSADTLLLAQSLALAGEPAALPLAAKLEPASPGDSKAITALYHHARGDLEAATTTLVDAFDRYRENPWGYIPLRERAIYLAWALARTRPESIAPVLEALQRPFAVYVAEGRRLLTKVAIALDKGPKDGCATALESIEPWVPWDEAYLRARLECYERVDSPFLQRARDDLDEFVLAAPLTPKNRGARAAGTSQPTGKSTSP
jgi:hypothetical protein